MSEQQVETKEELEAQSTPTIIPEAFLKRLPLSARFCKIKYCEKRPFEPGWDVHTYTYDQIKPWLDEGQNYGVVADKPLIIVETDDPIYESGFPETL